MSSPVIPIPKHRNAHMEKQWCHIRHLVTDGRQINLNVNLEERTVELSTHPDTPDVGDLARCANFIRAVMLGFSIPAAQSLLHKDDFLVETWNIEEMELELKRQIDAKRMYSNISKTNMAIEDFTTTTILMEKSVFHILGSSSKVRKAKDYIRHIISLY